MRNKIIFDEGVAIGPVMATKILSAYNELPDIKTPSPRGPIAPTPIDKIIPWALFDGAA